MWSEKARRNVGRMRFSTFIRTLAAAAAAACLIQAPSASAAVTCHYDDNASPKLMAVTLTGAGDAAILSYDSFDHQLLVNGNVCGGAGGLAMNDNVDKILVSDTSAGGTTVRIEDPAAFAPGATPEGPLNASEIEFELAMGGGSDQLVLMGSDASDVFTFGSAGVNTGAGPLDFDVEITGSGIDQTTVHGQGGSDEISGQGGRGTGAPTQLRMHLYGDTLDDALAGGDGDDDLHGGDGQDELEGGLGTDYLDGGSEADTVSYAHAPAGVRVALNPAEPLQETGAAGADHLVALEKLTGSEHDDELRTQVLEGVARGLGGNDRIIGSNAADEILSGGNGDDLIDPGPEATVAELIAGGAGSDTVTYARAPKAVTVDLAVETGVPRDGIGAWDEVHGIENVEGSPFADILNGGGGPTTIDGLGGADTINTRGGADLVRARDGQADSVDCGAGDDSAVADDRATDALLDCEAVDFLPDPPAPPQPPGSEPAPDKTVRLSVSARRAQRLLRSRALRVTLRCAGEPCRVRAGGKLGEIRLRRVTRSLAADVRTRVKVPLSRRAVRRIRAALDRGRRPRLKLNVRASDAAGNSILRTRTITARAS